MNANFHDQCCRRCGGPVQVLDLNRPSTVTCVECADTYAIDADDADERIATAEAPPRISIRKKAVSHDA